MEMILLSEIKTSGNMLCFSCMKYQQIFSLVKIIHSPKKKTPYLTMYNSIVKWDVLVEGMDFFLM